MAKTYNPHSLGTDFKPTPTKSQRAETADAVERAREANRLNEEADRLADRSKK